MKIQSTKQFEQDYARLPQVIKDRAEKQLTLLFENPRHPSLRIKKMEGYIDIWEGSITQKYRFTFSITGNTYFLRRIGKHDILRTP